MNKGGQPIEDEYWHWLRLHGENDDANTPAIHKMGVALVVYLQDYLWSKVAWCATHCLQKLNRADIRDMITSKTLCTYA
jgi:hypothetical protein